MSHAILDNSVTVLSSLIRSRDVSPYELVSASVARIEEINPKINAVVVSRFDEALKEARVATVRLSDPAFTPPSLFGIPFTVKETISVAGFPSTFGLYTNRHNVAKMTAPVIENLFRQGAIIVGFTNTPECCFWMECNNTVYGRTNNPHDLKRTPGGSSGGEAAIIASGAVPFGVGSDMAGSLRMPAAFCGLFAHAPTGGLVPIDGHYPFDFTRSILPNDTSQYARLLKIGPLCRKAEDLEVLHHAMQGTPLLNRSTEMQWQDINLYVIADPKIKAAWRSDIATRRMMKRLLAKFQSLGVNVHSLPNNTLRDAFGIWRSKMKAASGHKTLLQQFGFRNKRALVLEILKKILVRSKHTLPGLMMCVGEVLHSGKNDEKYLQAADKLKARLTALLGTNGILLMPVHPRPAPKHNTPVLRPYDWNYTTIANALDLPATAVPVGCTLKGLPLSVQIIAATGKDNLNFQIVSAMKKSGFIT